MGHSWTYAGSVFSEDGGYPYGIIDQTARLYRHGNDYATRTYSNQGPGCNEWGNSWRNKYCYWTHNWIEDSFWNPRLWDWEPSGWGEGCGSWSSSLSVSAATGPSFNVNWAQSGICRTDQTSLSRETVKNHIDYGSADNNTSHWPAGSSFATDGTWRCGEDIVAVQDTFGGMFDSYWNDSPFFKVWNHLFTRHC